MSPFEVYLILKLNAISTVLIIITSSLFIIGMTIALFNHLEDEPLSKNSRKFIIAALIFLVPALFVPNTSEMTKAIIIPKLLNEKNIAELEKIPTKLLETMGVSLDVLKNELISVKSNQKGEKK